MARKMKDSGIEWIGEIPEGWEVGQIGQLYSERRTKVSDKDYPPLSVTMKGILPQLSTAAKTDAHDDRKLVCKGDFAINSRSDRRGSCGISEQDGSISLINTVLQPRGEMNPGYYNWLFHTSMFADEFYKWGHGIVDDLWTTGWSDMKKIGVPVPSKCEQKQLAEHLNFECSNVDTILSKTRSSIEEYKKLKQAVITQAVTKGVRGEREMKDSGVEWIGEINHRFSLIKLKYICSILDQYRKPISADKRSQSGSILYDYYGASGAIDKIDDYTINDHVMLIGEDGANLRMRNLPLMYEVNGKAWINNHAHILKPTERVDFYYLFYALEGLDINPYITGSAQPKLSQEKLQNIWVPLPDFEEQQEIATYIRSKCAEIDGMIAKKEQLVKELESYKKSLIYEVVTGKREV
jgi:type I restriction enzyme S subunit